MYLRNWSLPPLIIFLGLASMANLCQRNLVSSVDGIREKFHIPALGGAIQRGDAFKTYVSGFRKEGDSTPAQTTDVFHLGSNTKAMSSTLIAVLVQSGKISWESKISEIFPDWASGLNPKYKDLTLKMLGSHMSGITPDLLGFEDGILLKIAMDPTKDLVTMRSEASKKVLSSNPATNPGTHFEYSNMNYIVLGAVIEKY